MLPALLNETNSINPNRISRTPQPSTGYVYSTLIGCDLALCEGSLLDRGRKSGSQFIANVTIQLRGPSRLLLS